MIAESKTKEVAEKIIKLAEMFNTDENAKIDENFNIIQGLDSLSLVSFLLNIEDEFGIDVDIETLDVSKLESVRIFAEYLEPLVND